MLKFRSGTSKAVNTRKAVAECLKTAGVESTNPPDLIIVHTTLGHDFGQMLSELSAGAPGSAIAGCTAATAATAATVAIGTARAVGP